MVEEDGEEEEGKGQRRGEGVGSSVEGRYR